jgi:hypothetical protein
VDKGRPSRTGILWHSSTKTGLVGLAWLVTPVLRGNKAYFVSRLRLCIFAGDQRLLMLEALGTRGWRIEQAELSSPPGTMVFV